MKFENTVKIIGGLVTIITSSWGGAEIAGKFSQNPWATSLGSAIGGTLALKVMEGSEKKKTESNCIDKSPNKINEQPSINYRTDHVKRLNSKTINQSISLN